MVELQKTFMNFKKPLEIMVTVAVNGCLDTMYMLSPKC